MCIPGISDDKFQNIICQDSMSWLSMMDASNHVGQSVQVDVFPQPSMWGPTPTKYHISKLPCTYLHHVNGGWELLEALWSSMSSFAAKELLAPFLALAAVPEAERAPCPAATGVLAAAAALWSCL